MKFCSSCGIELANEGVKFCPACGSPQFITDQGNSQKKLEGSSASLVTLCILTILGSLFGIFKGLFYEVFNTSSSYIFQESGQLPLGYASAMFNLATLAGASLMLNRMKLGYVIYMIGQAANIITVIFWAFFSSHYDYIGSSSSVLMLATSVTVIPSLLFMTLYTFMTRKQLR